MKHTIQNEAFEQVHQAEQAQPGLITQAQMMGLPEPVQRYLNYAQVVGKDPIRTVRLTEQGCMRTQPGQKWLPVSLQDHQDQIQPIGKGDGAVK